MYDLDESGYIVDEETGCWVWQRARDSSGYAIARIDGKVTRLSRYFYEDFYGTVPGGESLRCTCGNKACINPAHRAPFSVARKLRALNPEFI